MVVLVTGALWAGLVTYLLSRVVRQGRVFNAATLPEVSAAAVSGGVTIVVPMRDEIANVDGCLTDLLAQRHLIGGWKVVVVDDNSTDGTADRLKDIALAEPRLRVIRAGALSPGWTGKSRACWLGAAASCGEWLCFVDADLRAAPTLVASTIAAAQEGAIGMLSLSPFQELGSFWERLVVPAGLLAIAAATDLRRIDDPAAPDVTANGQFLLFHRAVYDAVGGHEAVRGEICEDKALAGLVKRRGQRFRMMGAEHLARTRMYRDFGSLWEGFGKNAVEVLRSGAFSVMAASAAAIIAWAAIALPLWGGLSAAHNDTATAAVGFGLALLASLALFGMHLGASRHSKVPLGYALLFPIAYTAVAALAWFSLALRWTGRVRWKGRTYRLGPNAALNRH